MNIPCLQRILLLWAVAGSGCSFDSKGIDAQDPSDPAGACEPVCEGDRLRLCEPDSTPIDCALGCNAEARACRQPVPSNGAEAMHLDGVNKPLRIPTSPGPTDFATIDTNTGRINVYGALARDGGEGVVDGIGFYRLESGVSVLAVTELLIEPDGFLAANGPRPLVILSAGNVSIEGIIDMSAFCIDEATERCGGPGGGDGGRDGVIKASGCAPGGAGGGAAGAGGADETGGGGGGLGDDGAAGGPSGDGLFAPGAGGAVSGSDCPGPELVPLRGGSGGGIGGLAGFGGVGGGGGGALQITSFTRIDILDEGASQFGPGIVSSGGGGGGAGGAILLEAPEIFLSLVTLAANGGAGGGGGGGGVGTTEPGQNGRFSVEQALGGGGRNAGGDGASLRGRAQAGVGGGDDTGGGGGGVGIIRFNVPADNLFIENTSISPAHTRGDLVIE